MLGNRVIVSAGDKVQVFYDDNGDCKADRKETLFSGIGGAQHDHGIHAFFFGPDGKLYFNFGNEGKHIKDKDGKPLIDADGNEVNNDRKPYQEGMVFRCNLGRQPDRNPGLELPQQLGSDGRFVRHPLAVGQRRRRQSRRPHQLHDGVRQLRL